MNLLFQIRKLKLREIIKEQISHREKKKGGKREKNKQEWEKEWKEGYKKGYTCLKIPFLNIIQDYFNKQNRSNCIFFVNI